MRRYEPVVAFCCLIVLVACGGGNAGDDILADAAPEITTCADGLVLWEEYNVCAPRVDDCPNPWELPLIGGGCMAIGPRACPKAWDLPGEASGQADADVDCEPGELMEYDGSACPEGFVLTEDEVACIPFFQEGCGEMEIPVLGGGCKKVGPEWGEEGEPYFDYCEAGHLALPGGGCVQVGPRACPKLWDPEAPGEASGQAPVDCEVGDVLPCDDGWVESEDGLYCEPVYDECPFGERPLLGGGCERVIPLAEDCPPGPFPEVPEGATDVVYVLAESTCAETCGSKEAPHQSIQAAVDVVPEGGWVLVGEGVYDEGVLIQKPVHLLGVCAAKAKVQGHTPFPEPWDSGFLQGTLVVYAADDVEISNLGVRTVAAGVALLEANSVTLTSLDVEAVGGTGAFIASSQASISRLWVHGSPGDESLGPEGPGLTITGGTQVEMEEALVEWMRFGGLWVSGQAAELHAERTVVRTTRCHMEAGQSGYGVIVQNDAAAELEDVVLTDNGTGGALVAGKGSSATLRRMLIDNSGEQAGCWDRSGVGAAQGRVTVSQSVVRGSVEVGLGAIGSAAELNVLSSAILDLTPDTGALPGVGVYTVEGGSLSVEGSIVDGVGMFSLVVFDEGSTAKVSGTIIRNNRCHAEDESGMAVAVQHGGEADVWRSVVEESESFGVVAQHDGSLLMLNGSTVSRCAGIGVEASDGGRVEIENGLLDGNREGGASAVGLGASLAISNSVVRDTATLQPSDPGLALSVNEGALAQVSQSLIEGNRRAGLVVSGDGSMGTVSGSAFVGTLGDPDTGLGPGMAVLAGGKLSASDVLVGGSSGVGLITGDSGSEVALKGTAVLATLPDAAGQGGFGVQVSAGAHLTMADSLVERNSHLGVQVDGEQAEVEINCCAIRLQEPALTGEWGIGVQLVGGSTAMVASSLFDGNTGLALGVRGEGTAAVVENSVFSGTKPDSDGLFGIGLLVSEGGSLGVAGSLIERSHELGVAVLGEKTRLGMTDSIVRDTRLAADGGNGFGLYALGQAVTYVARSLFRNNSTAGLAASGTGASLSITESAVLDTRDGGGVIDMGSWEVSQNFGDGVVAEDGAVLEMHGSYVADNARCGAYYYGSSGFVSGSVVAGNLHYGLAMENCEQDVSYAGAENYFFGNGSALPFAEPQQITASPKAGGVPSIPSVLEIPSLERR